MCRSAFDVIIVGGGSAGAVMANRLSGDAGTRVLLIEAGPAYGPGEYPDVLADANRVRGDDAHDWGYQTQDLPMLGHNVKAPRGRVLGGSSAVNAAVAMRARPTDLARWTARGLDGWSFDEVLPMYKALENTASGDDAWHGRSGPLPIRQTTMDDNTPSMQAFVLAAEALGFPRVQDFNGASQHGVSPYPLNVVDGIRVNTAMAYLTEDVRRRPNLTITGSAEVDVVMFTGRRVAGIRLVSGDVVTADRVILCAGAFGSPAILMRSGIGPPCHLRELGIPVLQDAPVGQRLKEHPFFYNTYALRPPSDSMEPVAGAILWTASTEACQGELDLQISGTHIADPEQRRAGGVIVLASSVTLPNSIGSVRLRDRDPRVPPVIRYNFFSDRSDLRRMLEAVRLSREIGRTAPFCDVVGGELTPGPAVADDIDLERSVIAAVDGYAHPTSTVPMGGADDSDAVVDGLGRVRGVENLFVVDASIMPDIPSAPTNLTTMMIAETIAGRMVGGGPAQLQEGAHGRRSA
ncbi:dehydrogenase [Mycolicibacterium goodii]|uniref:Dehydrogenase n=2 Tax=Mycolicibacterium goodii TaxID=134601 RepID=A0A0K0X5C0_MYCGD|nr:dehydrogenase [Mycolicibacterium goodii]